MRRYEAIAVFPEAPRAVCLSRALKRRLWAEGVACVFAAISLAWLLSPSGRLWVESGFQRWLIWVGLGAYALFGGLGVLRKARQELRLLQLARNGRAAVAEIISRQEKDSPDWNMDYVFRCELLEGRQRFDLLHRRGFFDADSYVYEEPLFLDAGGTVALALADRDGALLLQAHLKPLLLDETEVGRVGEAAKRDRQRS